MSFKPEVTLLGTFLEYRMFNFVITYEQEIAPVPPAVTPTIVILPVVVTPISDIPQSVIVKDNTISGYFYDSFTNSLKYLNHNQDYIITDKFDKISELDEIIYYHAETTRIKTFSFLATASNLDTMIYTINVKNDWTSGRNQLLKYINPEKYDLITVDWSNYNDTVIKFINDGKQITWENNQ